MEKRLKPRLLERSVGDYKNRMDQQDLTPKERSLVESHTERLRNRESLEYTILLGTVLIEAINLSFNYPF